MCEIATVSQDRYPKSFPCGRPRPARKTRPLNEAERQELVEKFEHFTNAKKLNRSKTRNNIALLIAAQGDHFTGPELVAKVRAAHPEIGAATVYRNLPVFLESGILRESLTDRDGQVVYELQRNEHHDHVVCLDCRAILEFHEVGIESLQQAVLKKLGFREVHHSHVVYARCDYRQKAE